MGDYARKAEDYMSKAQKKLNVRSRSPFTPHPFLALPRRLASFARPDPPVSALAISSPPARRAPFGST
jgi:hypothetical protein